MISHGYDIIIRPIIIIIYYAFRTHTSRRKKRTHLKLNGYHALTSTNVLMIDSNSSLVKSVAI